MSIPRTFCITLKETPLRTKGFFESATAAGLEVTPFYGIFGSRMGLTPKFFNEIECPNRNIKMNERAVGCNLSHFMLWNTLKYMPEDEFLVFEDDALIPSDFKERFEKVYNKLPADWEMVYVGWIKYGQDITPVTIDEGISIRLPSATHAYLVKKSLLDNLMNCLLPFQSNIDLTILTKLLPKIRYYVFDPSLVDQRSYLNVQDPVWSSLVYDWENDLYNCKKAIKSNLALVEGWYGIERNDKEVWLWSKDTFTINFPTGVDSITLECSIPFDNNLELTMGNEFVNIQLKRGNNAITIPNKGHAIVAGRLTVQFIPNKYDSKSNDSRVLGICLKRVILNMGVNIIPVDVEELSSPVLPSMSFKL